MNNRRRLILKSSVATGAVAVAAGAGLLTPQTVLAAWPKEAFTARSVAEAMQAAMGSTEATDSAQISIKAPDIAENGAVVPVTVETNIANVESIAIVAHKNPTPLTSKYVLTASEPYVSTRLKLAGTGDVEAIVQAGGKLYSAKKEVKVTIGGCGG